jgi:phospholipase/carboxylesterase
MLHAQPEGKFSMAGEFDVIEAETGPDPTATILILHGLGADGGDFAPVAQELRLAGVGPVRFVLPHAPVRPVTVNGGYRMRAWYDLRGTEVHGIEDEAGLRESQALVESLLARERERGIASNRIVLGGFSQGCALSLMAGVRHGEPLAGIFGLSGYLPLAQQTATERSQANAATPIFMGHGEQDDIVEIARGEASREALRALGCQVEWHAYPVAHSVSLEEIRDLDEWLSRVLAG